ncbi:hypothetical protein [Kitasatospora sp. SUK 42]|uniref:hypothetical protein n=1 Tax=Kitasatospora sp. SUK 42 TaxID=1588882 RepID=UPI0018CBAEF0|nr:hypothetical protein [Kitasatospora sp. SUK 42]MBV2155453.1 hypothetical protein [Kitasatospora sp. SUK 42]
MLRRTAALTSIALSLLIALSAPASADAPGRIGDEQHRTSPSQDACLAAGKASIQSVVHLLNVGVQATEEELKQCAADESETAIRDILADIPVVGPAA